MTCLIDGKPCHRDDTLNWCYGCDKEGNIYYKKPKSGGDASGTRLLGVDVTRVVKK